MKIEEADFGSYRIKCRWCVPALEDNSFQCTRNRGNCTYTECPFMFYRSKS